MASSNAFESPARFRYHPSQQAGVLAQLPLADGRRLLAGKRGERWLLDAPRHTLAAASNLAPEDLIGILEADDGYGFVGQSGTQYEAREPLGKFLRSSAPLEPLLRVSAAHRTMLGIPGDRSLLRSVGSAASFARVGPEHVAFADVELTADGGGLALAIPEALWRTSDEGATWTLLPGKTHGAFGLTRDRLGQVRVDTVFGAYHFDAGKADIEPGVSPGIAPDLSSFTAPRGPDASALADGRAVVIAGRYVEVSSPPSRPSEFELVQGAFDGPLSASALPELKNCRGARIAGFDRYLELACFRGPSDAGSVPIGFFRSDSAGRHFEVEPFTAFGTPSGFRFAMGLSGSLVATGLCGLPDPGCSTGGLFFRREATLRARASGRYELFASAAATLAESALGITFSLDGRTAYAPGRRSKTSAALAMFVSHDGGESFEGRDLDLVRADSDDDDRSSESAQSLRLESLAAAEDGAVSLVVADRHGRVLIVTDDRGRLLSAAKAPEPQALVSAVGLRALALSTSSRRSWESLDGGISWRELSRFPIALCDEAKDADCAVTMRCVPGGCVVADEISRVGWGGQSEEDDSLPPPSRDLVPFSERKVRTPIACALEDSPWQSLPFVRELPNSHDAALGNVGFVALARDPVHATLSTIHGFGAPHPHLETVALLPPLANSSDYAIQVLNQVEGAAGVRYRLPRDPGKDSHLRDVDVAWDNALSGQVGRARLADGGPVAPADYERGEAARSAAPDLLSIGEGGLYLRLHHAAADDQDTWYFDGRTSTRIPAVAWPIPNSLRGRTEMARHDTAHLALMLFADGTAVARARRAGPASGANFEFDAETTALPDPSAFGEHQTSTVTYLGNASGLFVQSESIRAGTARAVFYGFRNSGAVLDPPIQVPTQSDLADRPSRCRPSDRSGTPRVDASYLPGTRHPVVVSDASDAPRLFLSSGAVLYGTPQNACAVAMDAEEVTADASTSRHERVLFLLDDLDHAWLFRQPQDANGAPESAQYRIMKCHFDPNVEVPSDVYRAAGTLVPHR